MIICLLFGSLETHLTHRFFALACIIYSTLACVESAELPRYKDTACPRYCSCVLLTELGKVHKYTKSNMNHRSLTYRLAGPQQSGTPWTLLLQLFSACQLLVAGQLPIHCGIAGKSLLQNALALRLTPRGLLQERVGAQVSCEAAAAAAALTGAWTGPTQHVYEVQVNC
jgi:hypothetical protein